MPKAPLPPVLTTVKQRERQLNRYHHDASTGELLLMNGSSVSEYDPAVWFTSARTANGKQLAKYFSTNPEQSQLKALYAFEYGPEIYDICEGTPLYDDISSKGRHDRIPWMRHDTLRQVENITAGFITNFFNHAARDRTEQKHVNALWVQVKNRVQGTSHLYYFQNEAPVKIEIESQAGIQTSLGPSDNIDDVMCGSTARACHQRRPYPSPSRLPPQ